jgi:membrane protease YdiL (CAAX protease family)
LIWGAFRVFVVLPLIFFLINAAQKNGKSIYLQLGDKNRMLALTFWSTLIFTALGIFLYPAFVNQSGLTIQKFFILFPIFSLYSISNAFVEETFFRGASLSILTEKVPFAVANFVQAGFFQRFILLIQ